MNTTTTTLCLCLLFLCAPVAASESDAGAEAADDVVTDSADQQEKASAEHEDILDRAFSPLDEAVSDINRHLNEGDGSAAPESHE
jgi:hypothetical protein